MATTEHDFSDLSEFQQRAASVAVRKLFKASHFSICDLDAIGKVLGVTHQLCGPDYDALRALHCVEWGDMGPRLAQLARDKCLLLLGVNAAIVVDEAEQAKRPPEADSARKEDRLVHWWPLPPFRR